MKSFFAAFLLATIAATLASNVAAMATGEAAKKGPRAYPMDCTRWQDPARCEFLNRRIEACKAKTDDGWRDCMRQSAATTKFAPAEPRDCSKARNQEFCEAHSSALGACRGRTTRAEHRKCMAEQLPRPAKG